MRCIISRWSKPEHPPPEIKHKSDRISAQFVPGMEYKQPHSWYRLQEDRRVVAPYAPAVQHILYHSRSAVAYYSTGEERHPKHACGSIATERRPSTTTQRCQYHRTET
eukprot:2197842-Rhodomonas_salina.1